MEGIRRFLTLSDIPHRAAFSGPTRGVGAMYTTGKRCGKESWVQDRVSFTLTPQIDLHSGLGSAFYLNQQRKKAKVEARLEEMKAKFDRSVVRSSRIQRDLRVAREENKTLASVQVEGSRQHQEALHVTQQDLTTRLDALQLKVCCAQLI